jgi:hypothetical protein
MSSFPCFSFNPFLRVCVKERMKETKKGRITIAMLQFLVFTTEVEKNNGLYCRA